MSFGPEVPVVLFASTVWDSPARVNAHHVAKRLADRGHRVLFVESTGLRAPAARAGHDWRRVAHRLRDFAGGVRSVAQRLEVLAPLAIPGGGPPWLRRLSAGALSAQIARAVGRGGYTGAVLWAFLPTAAPLLRAPWARLGVYHCVDHYAANPGVDAQAIERLEAAMLADADLVFATSEVLAQRLARERADVLCMPNVADAQWFARALDGDLPEPSELAGLARPRVLFAGNLAGYRIDLGLLLELARARRDLAFVLLGPRGLGDVEGASAVAAELLVEPNVRAVEAVPYERLPDFFAHCDVGLIPFLDNAHTRSSLPLKLFEYLAAGLPVVATDLPNLAAHAEPCVLQTGIDAASFSLGIDSVLEAPVGAREQRRARARENDWEGRMDALCDSVAAALARSDASAPAGPSAATQSGSASL